MSRASERQWNREARMVGVLEKPRSREVAANVLSRGLARIRLHENGLALGKPGMAALRSEIIADLLFVARDTYPVPVEQWLNALSFVSLEAEEGDAREVAAFDVTKLSSANFVTPTWMPYAVVVLGDVMTGTKDEDGLRTALADLREEEPAPVGATARFELLLRAALATDAVEREALLAEYEADVDARDGRSEGVRMRTLVVEALRRAAS